MIGDAERSKLQVGYKQAVRALNENKASKVFVAEDCDDHIKDGVSKIAMQSNTPVFFIANNNNARHVGLFGPAGSNLAVD